MAVQMSKKSELEKSFRKYGYNDGFQRIGFCINDLGPSQTAFLSILKANTIVDQTSAVNVEFFFVDNRPPCLSVSCATYNVRDASVYTGNIIATCKNTLLAIKECYRARRYFYVQDLSWLKYAEDPVLKEALASVKIFTRAADYTNRLRELGYNVSDVVVNDFDILSIINIITKEN